jgi:DNA-binding transcriptional LysR family regulator
MHRRYQNINIPTEIIRTLVAVSELGSFSKTAEKLGLSQPAISAQVKRLQMLVGGDIFEKIASGVAFTAKGKLILASAKKLLEANDQILSIGGATEELQPLRLGVSTTFVDRFLHNWRSPDQIRHVSIVCNHTAELSRSLMDGYLDVACLINPSDDAGSMRSVGNGDYRPVARLRPANRWRRHRPSQCLGHRFALRWRGAGELTDLLPGVCSGVGNVQSLRFRCDVSGYDRWPHPVHGRGRRSVTLMGSRLPGCKLLVAVDLWLQLVSCKSPRPACRRVFPIGCAHSARCTLGKVQKSGAARGLA